MRYKVQISYYGSAYCGWQNQPNGVSIQEILENCLSIKLQKDITITGCCRTDSGVHAIKSYFHFDAESELPDDFIYAMNHLLPVDISINEVDRVNDDFHARFDATSRAYVYKIHCKKNPFKHNNSFYFPRIKAIDQAILDETAQIIRSGTQFGAFCKTMSDAKTMECQIKEAFWLLDYDQDMFEFHISSNRFLRGMVRLIVGACLQVGLGKMNKSDLLEAVSVQKLLSKPWSVPPEGLYLKDIFYP
jgi:tRNA pseudouridine38-40 synthase